MTARYMTLENCAGHVGEIFKSSWMEIAQDRITAFGETIEDPDPHHVDPETGIRRGAVSPYFDGWALGQDN